MRKKIKSVKKSRSSKPKSIGMTKYTLEELQDIVDKEEIKELNKRYDEATIKSNAEKAKLYDYYNDTSQLYLLGRLGYKPPQSYITDKVSQDMIRDKRIELQTDIDNIFYWSAFLVSMIACGLVIGLGLLFKMSGA